MGLPFSKGGFCRRNNSPTSKSRRERPGSIRSSLNLGACLRNMIKYDFGAAKEKAMSEQQKYRLVTRSDFDGLVCAVLLNELNLIGEIKFVHPKDMQDGKVKITGRDITTTVSYT